MSDPMFQVAVSSYVGQTCPLMLMTPLVGRFFDKEEEKLDKYGANLSSATLPAKGHGALRNILQSISIVVSIMKLC